MTLELFNYEDLLNGDKHVENLIKIEKAYGLNGLGVLAVKNIPDFDKLRENLINNGKKFGDFDQEIKEKYKDVGIGFGWSHGIENLDGKPDLSKGSYYNNPLHDDPFINVDNDIKKKYPGFCSVNVWPTKDLPKFEESYKALGSKMVNIGKIISGLCDDYVDTKIKNYKRTFSKVVESSRCPKGRFLYYFPKDEEVKDDKNDNDDKNNDEDHDFSSWCGWHLDHGSLTALCSARFFNKQGKVIECPDKKAGLYIKNREGKCVHVTVPEDYLLFQLGETGQIHTGGLLQATPHAVRGCQTPGVCRLTFAVFMEPEYDGEMNVPKGVDGDKVAKLVSGNLPPGVPGLETRWDSKDNFGDFGEKTIKAYEVKK